MTATSVVLYDPLHKNGDFPWAIRIGRMSASVATFDPVSPVPALIVPDPRAGKAAEKLRQLLWRASR